MDAAAVAIVVLDSKPRDEVAADVVAGITFDARDRRVPCRGQSPRDLQAGESQGVDSGGNIDSGRQPVASLYPGAKRVEVGVVRRPHERHVPSAPHELSAHEPMVARVLRVRAEGGLWV